MRTLNLFWKVNFVGLREIYALQKNVSNVKVRKFLDLKKQKNSLTKTTEMCAIKQNLVFQSWNYKLWKAEKTDQENNGKAVSVGSSPVSWLHLGISFHVLHTDLHTSRRIYLIIKSFFTSWSFPLLS